MNRVRSTAKFRRCVVFRAIRPQSNLDKCVFFSLTKKQNEYLGMFVTLGSMERNVEMKSKTRSSLCFHLNEFVIRTSKVKLSPFHLLMRKRNARVFAFYWFCPAKKTKSPLLDDRSRSLTTNLIVFADF